MVLSVCKLYTMCSRKR